MNKPENKMTGCFGPIFLHLMFIASFFPATKCSCCLAYVMCNISVVFRLEVWRQL